jgi:hypothetical protein
MSAVSKGTCIASTIETPQILLCIQSLLWIVSLPAVAGGLPALQEALQHKLQTKNGLHGVSDCCHLQCINSCELMHHMPRWFCLQAQLWPLMYGYKCAAASCGSANVVMQCVDTHVALVAQGDVRCWPQHAPQVC